MAVRHKQVHNRIGRKGLFYFLTNQPHSLMPIETDSRVINWCTNLLSNTGEYDGLSIGTDVQTSEWSDVEINEAVVAAIERRKRHFQDSLNDKHKKMVISSLVSCYLSDLQLGKKNVFEQSTPAVLSGGGSVSSLTRKSSTDANNKMSQLAPKSGRAARMANSVLLEQKVKVGIFKLLIPTPT